MSVRRVWRTSEGKEESETSRAERRADGVYYDGELVLPLPARAGAAWARPPREYRVEDLSASAETPYCSSMLHETLPETLLRKRPVFSSGGNRSPLTCVAPSRSRVVLSYSLRVRRRSGIGSPVVPGTHGGSTT